MFCATGSIKAAGAQPIAAMHCSVIFLHGDFPGAGRLTISLQPTLAPVACNGPELIGAGAIALATD